MSSRISRRDFIALGAGLVVGAAIGYVGGYYTPRPAPTAPTGKAKEVRIGVVLPFSGPVVKEGQLAWSGIELAITHINRQGGVKSLGGARVVPITADSQGKPEVGVSEAERLITTQGIHALTGCYQSAVTLPVAPVAEKYHMPMMVADAISDAITEKGYKYVFRVHGKASWYGKSRVQTIKYLNEHFKTDYKKVGLVYIDDEYGHSTADGFKRWLKELTTGYEVVYEEAYPGNIADATPIVSKMKASNADIINQVGYVSDTTLTMKTMKTLNWYPNAAYMGLGAAGPAYHDFINILKEDAEYAFTDTEWQPDLLKSSKLAPNKWVNDEYKAKYGKDMVGTPADTYTSTWVLYYGIEKAGSLDPDAIRKALHSLVLEPPKPGLILPYKIDLTHDDNQNPYAVIPCAQIRNGEFRIVWPADFSTLEAVWPAPGWGKR